MSKRNYEWSLDVLYKGYDDPNFAEDSAKLDEALARTNRFAEEIPSMPPREALLAYIQQGEEDQHLIMRLYSYASLRMSANTRDTESASVTGRLMGKLGSTAKARTKIEKYIASLENLDELIESEPILKEYEYMLRNLRDAQKHTLNDECEEIAALYDISGGSAWGDLQSYLTSSVTAAYRGETLNLSSVRNLAYSPDASVRKDAYQAELACYEKIKDPVAFSINSIKLQVINGARLRGFASPLEQVLFRSHMTRETLDALLDAMKEHMDLFRRYLRIKAKALGHPNGLPWYDLFAPMGSSDRTFTVEQAKEYLLHIFRGFDEDLANMVARAFDEAWIDFYPREGKVGGAFCAGLDGLKQSRILTNFDGTLSDVVTLAHELGHAFHNLNLESHRPLNNDYSMPVAETASTFNENVVMNAAIDSAASDEEKLFLIESQLQDVTQIMCDIYSRYLFETAVFASRESDFLPADKLCELMLDAQREAYGDGLDPNALHPFMWVCKSHYYSSGNSFYNFPYAFGGLFARGLYAKYVEQGQAFVPVYRKLLYTTPIATVEDAARVAGIDLTGKDFWTNSLLSYKKNVDEFERLVSALAGARK
ncbi:MAG: M3 family oligoendopeptidase [Oscillospiraceae bacterium]|nr:M3 family oligoendopeptidase [Oscillospiraceae bacterium]